MKTKYISVLNYVTGRDDEEVLFIINCKGSFLIHDNNARGVPDLVFVIIVSGASYIDTVTEIFYSKFYLKGKGHKGGKICSKGKNTPDFSCFSSKTGPLL